MPKARLESQAPRTSVFTSAASESFFNRKVRIRYRAGFSSVAKGRVKSQMGVTYMYM